MWRIFWFKSLHFSLELFVALAAFAAAWVYLDSYFVKKQTFLPFKIAGFLLLALAAVLHATGISHYLISNLILLANLLGLALLITGFLREPFQTKPKIKPAFAFIPFVWISNLSQTPQAALVNTLLLVALVTITFIHATTGYQKQLRPLVFGLALLALAEAFEAFHFLDYTKVLWLSNLLTPFGAVFVAEHLLKLLAFIWVIKWVWQYLPYRLNAELFLAFVSTTLAITLTVTLAFTTLLLKSIEKEGLTHLESDVQTLNLALKNLQAKTLSDARVISESSQIAQALTADNQTKLQTLTKEFMISTSADFLTITDLEGRIIINASDPEKKGQFITKDQSFEQALEGQNLATAIERQGLVSPQILIQSSAPLLIDDQITAVVLTGSLIDNAFVDGIKTSTGLETTVFAHDTRVATTFLSPDGKSRQIGSQETNSKILQATLEKGETFVGPTTILNRPFYSAYTPLKNASETVIGMFSVGMPQLTILDSAEAAIQKTYIVTSLVISLSLIPAFWISKTIAYQVTPKESFLPPESPPESKAPQKPS
jgi:hypothetical protein